MLSPKIFVASLILLASTLDASTASSDKAGARRTVEAVFAAFNRHDAAAMAALYAPDAVLATSDYCEPLRGRAAVRRLHEELFAAVPDIQDEVLEYYVEGNRVAVRFVSRSRLPGRAFEMEIADFFEVRNGLVVNDRTIFNAGQKCKPLSALGEK